MSSVHKSEFVFFFYTFLPYTYMMQTLQLFLGENVYFFIAQAIGFIALAILMYGLTQRDDIKSIKIVSLSMAFWSINYIMLGLTAALLATLIGFVRMYFSLKFKGNMYGFAFVLFLTAISAYFSFDGQWISVLPVISTVFGIVGFQLFSGIKMRLVLMSGSVFWITYLIAVNNVPGIINEVLVQLIMLSTVIKMYFGEDDTMTLRQRIRFLISKKAKSMRPRIDFGSFLVLRDRKRYLNDDFNNIVYEETPEELKATL